MYVLAFLGAVPVVGGSLAPRYDGPWSVSATKGQGGPWPATLRFANPRDFVGYFFLFLCSIVDLFSVLCLFF